MATRIPLLNPETAIGRTRDIFASVKGKLGMVPNLYQVLGHSPAALAAHLGLNDNLASGTINAPLREKIALAVSQVNRCGYCLSAHTLIGSKMLGVAEDDLLRARRRQGGDVHETTMLVLAAKIAEDRGRISDADVETARGAGVTDAELVELAALVATLSFSNYINHIARTPIDFPPAPNLPKEE